MRKSTRGEAIARKEGKYFTGKPCKHGHVAERYTLMGNCVECAKEAQVKTRNVVRAQLAAK